MAITGTDTSKQNMGETVDTLTVNTALTVNGNPIVPASGRFVFTTATTLSLTAALHAEKQVIINTNSSSGFAGTLPAATGTGQKYLLINNLAQTQGTVSLVTAGSDVINGKAIALDTTASADAQVFKTTATSKTTTLNRTTTGGLGFDEIEVWDYIAGTWLIKVTYVGSGSLATPFS